MSAHDQVKMRSLEWALNQYDCGETGRHIHTERECHMKMKAEIGRDASTSYGTSNIASKAPEAGERPGAESPSQPQREPTLPTP